MAGREDLDELARLLWLDTPPDQQATQPFEAFARDLRGWWAAHHSSHLPFVAREGGPGLVGMAWLALIPRVPRPGAPARLSADIQAVFVEAGQRGRGIGSALVEAATAHAFHQGAVRVTVHSGRTAVPVYERLGFTSSRQLLMRS